MEKEKLKETVLVNLRSVIQSCKGGVPINRLQNDYRQLIGMTIPCDALGYKSLEAFLQNIPQVAKLKKLSDGQLVVEAVSDSTTSHLESLINKQKATKTTVKCSYKTHKRPQPRSNPSARPNIAPLKKTFHLGDQSQECVGGMSSASSTYSTTSEASLIRDRELESMKTRLEEQIKLNGVLSARVDRLVTGSESILEDEQVMVQRLKYQVGYLQKRTMRHHSSSTTAMQMHQCLNEIVEKVDFLSILLKKLSPNSPTLTSLDVPVENNQKAECCDLFKMYNKMCQETEELKNQVILLNTQVQIIEKRNQNQNPSKSGSPASSSDPRVEELKQEVEQIKNSEQSQWLELIKLKMQLENATSTQPTEQMKSMMAELQEQKLKILDVEKTMKSESSKHKAQKESVADKESLKKMMAQNVQIQGDQRRIQSDVQKLKNQVGKVNVNDIVQVVVKTLVNNKLISIPQLVTKMTENGSSCHISAQDQQSTSSTSQNVVTTQKKKQKKKKSQTPVTPPTSITSSMRDAS